MRGRPQNDPERPVPASHPSQEPPPPEVAEFIRHAFRRRRMRWPEIYDDMWAMAAGGTFRGWDRARLAELGVTFSLRDMPRLAAWVRATLPRTPDHVAPREHHADDVATHPEDDAGEVEAASSKRARRRTPA